MVLRKDELEIQLKDEHQMIQAGMLRDDSPFDASEDFLNLCIACRVGDLKTCQELIVRGVNINARDLFDYTPLILASLCGHYDVVELLLGAGALCERDTFQGERCLYNALNNRIRNLLLQYDYSKSADPLQPLAAHITSLLANNIPQTFDIVVTAGSQSFQLHKFVLSARSPYFQKKLLLAPETSTWKLANTMPAEAFDVAVRYVYLGNVPSDLGMGPKSSVTEEEVFKGIDKVSKQLEIESLWQGILGGSDRRIARQRHDAEVSRGRDQIEAWYQTNVLGHKMEVDTKRVDGVKWTRDNAIFADVILRADKFVEQNDVNDRQNMAHPNGIPIGPTMASGKVLLEAENPNKSILYPVHRAMLVRSDYFQTMFSSQFHEAQITEHLQIIPVDCSPEVLEVVLNFLYTEKAEMPIEIALDVLLAADMLFIEKLKTKAAVVISTIGSGGGSVLVDRTHVEDVEEVELINIYDVIRAAWFTRVQRLETFAAQYFANRLEDYIDEEDFADLIKESASRIEKRQETDTIELLDDIRFYLSERFRLRFEDAGLEEIMEEEMEASSGVAQAVIIKPSSEKDATVDRPGDTSSKRLVVADEVADATTKPKGNVPSDILLGAQVRALNGEIAEDEAAADSMNYEILLDKIDVLLDKLRLDA